MMRVRIVNPVLRQFVWRFLNSEKARLFFRDKATGTAGNMPKINGQTVRSLPILLPCPEEQQVIVARIESAFAWTDKIATELAHANALRPRLDQAVLAKAFRGELVPQDPADEPASVLLERIRAERSSNPSGQRKKAGEPSQLSFA
jgi:type I restriction enzyme S subunit